MASVLALRHVAFVDLDGFASCFRDNGFDIRYHDMWFDETTIDPTKPDLLVVLGAPVGVYEGSSYDFIQTELKLVEERLAAGLPVLGLCFGAQIIARALGAHVYQGETFEYGWRPISLTPDGEESVVAPFVDGHGHVFQSHGDTFDLPVGATRLMTSSVYENQAFAYGNCVSLQFHGEVSERGLRRWFIAHSARVREHGGLAGFIEDTDRYASEAETAQRQFLERYLEALQLGSRANATKQLPA